MPREIGHAHAALTCGQRPYHAWAPASVETTRRLPSSRSVPATSVTRRGQVPCPISRCLPMRARATGPQGALVEERCLHGKVAGIDPRLSILLRRLPAPTSASRRKQGDYAWALWAPVLPAVSGASRCSRQQRFQLKGPADENVSHGPRRFHDDAAGAQHSVRWRGWPAMSHTLWARPASTTMALHHRGSVIGRDVLYSIGGGGGG